MVKTPMLERMLEVQDESQSLGDFLQWLMQRYAMFDKQIARETLFMIPTHGDYINIERVLADYLGIDLHQADLEKQRLIDELYHK